MSDTIEMVKYIKQCECENLHDKYCKDIQIHDSYDKFEYTRHCYCERCRQLYDKWVKKNMHNLVMFYLNIEVQRFRTKMSYMIKIGVIDKFYFFIYY